jgi:hypothetical protein
LNRFIPFGLQENIKHFAILVNCPPKVMLLAVDLHEDLVDVEGIAVTAMSSFQLSRKFGTELDTEPAP